MADDQQDQNDQRDADDTDQHDDSQSQDTTDLGDKGREALKRERETRKAAEKERNDLAKRIAAFEKAQQDRDDETAKQKGEWETIAKKREDELNELTKKLAERDLNDLKRSVAAKNGLPDDLIDRLHGDTEETLTEDALKLAKLVKTREAPDTDTDRRTTSGKPKPKQGDTLTSYEFGKRTF